MSTPEPSSLDPWRCPDRVCDSEAEHYKLLWRAAEETWVACLHRELALKAEVQALSAEVEGLRRLNRRTA